jgi:hypothetical protein
LIDQFLQVRYNENMSDKRQNPRYETMAHTEISGVLGGECLLKNISITGCGVEYPGNTADLHQSAQ